MLWAKIFGEMSFSTSRLLSKLLFWLIVIVILANDHFDKCHFGELLFWQCVEQGAFHFIILVTNSHFTSLSILPTEVWTKCRLIFCHFWNSSLDKCYLAICCFDKKSSCHFFLKTLTVFNFIVSFDSVPPTNFCNMGQIRWRHVSL